MGNLIDDIISFWSYLNPVAGYTGGYLSELNKLFFQTGPETQAALYKIQQLTGRLGEITDVKQRETAGAVLTSLKTQLDLSRPSGAGPSGTGMGGIWGSADGVFYILLKKDDGKGFIRTYLEQVLEMVKFETTRWQGIDFTIEVRKECLDTATYLKGTLSSLQARRPDMADIITAINAAIDKYYSLFYVQGLDSPDFNTLWNLLVTWDKKKGPVKSGGYPECLKSYYQLTETANEIDNLATGWMQLDLPVTIDIAERAASFLGMKPPYTLEAIWNKVSEKYAVDFDEKKIAEVTKICDDYGVKYIIGHTPADKVYFSPTPKYLENLITGGGDYAINYLQPDSAYSQLYLTESDNTSLLTMINILVHEASHGYNFVLSAKNASKLLNLNTALEVPMTEGQALYREYQYWSAAVDILDKEQIDDVEKAYIALYGKTRDEQETGVLCAQLETYLWRVIRYIRALCDVKVNGGQMTYTDFIAWAAAKTGLSIQMLHGECFTFLAAPGYAPCYAVGCAAYSNYQKTAFMKGTPEIDFNTYASRIGFYSWPINKTLMEAFANGVK
jgi:hypothetical protein